jgi:F-type H+-transporting ATPase subunit c
MEYTVFIHYGTIGCAIGLTSLGAGIGEGIAGFAAMKAIDQQPYAYSDITRTALIGTALIETIALIGLFIAIMLIIQGPVASYTYAYIAEFGIALAICLSGVVTGVVSGFVSQESCHAIARQPLSAQKILGFTILTQALVQTPIIIGFIIALLIKNGASNAYCLAESIRLIASGLCVGLGGIGPAIGLAHFARNACHALGLHKDAYRQIVPFSLISQTLIETPVIFSLVIALVILFVLPPLQDGDIAVSIGALAAGLVTGIGTLGPGISSGMVSASVCQHLVTATPHASALTRTSMFAQAIIETSVIYAVLISFAIIFICRTLLIQ